MKSGGIGRAAGRQARQSQALRTARLDGGDARGYSIDFMEHLTPEQIETLRRRLEIDRDVLLRLRHAEVVAATTSGDLVPDVGDRQDAAATEAARLAQWSLADHERAHLQEIEDALRRMQEGSYGVCELSEEPIPYARLLAEPTARTTVEAEAEREAGAPRDPATLRRAY